MGKQATVRSGSTPVSRGSKKTSLGKVSPDDNSKSGRARDKRRERSKDSSIHHNKVVRVPRIKLQDAIKDPTPEYTLHEEIDFDYLFNRTEGEMIPLPFFILETLP